MSCRWLIIHALRALLIVASVQAVTLSSAQAQFVYVPHLPPVGPSQASFVGYVASQGIPLGDNGQPTLVEYDAQGEVTATAAFEPGMQIKSTQEWNSWVASWEQARTEHEDAGGSTQRLLRTEYEDPGRECLDAEANPVRVSSVDTLRPETQWVLVVHVTEGLPSCQGYVLAQSPLSDPTLTIDVENASVLVDGAWGVQQVSQPGRYFAVRTGYFDAEASGCPEQSGLPPTIRNLQAFVNCPAGLVQGVYAPVWGAEIETTSQASFSKQPTSPTGYYQLPYVTYDTLDDWSGDWVSAKLTFARFEPRLPSSRSFYLRKRGVGHTVSFAVDTVQLRAQARLTNDGSFVLPVVDLDYQFDEFTQYGVDPGGARGQDQGLLTQISAQDLRETDIYLFRVADNKLIGERRGMSPNELSGIAVDPGQFPNAQVASGCEGGAACLSFVVVTRGPALSGAGGVAERNAFLPFASRPADGQPGLEPEYPDSPVRTFLRPGDAVKVVAINRSTGYTGVALGKVNVDIGGLSVIEPTDASGPDILIDMFPPNLRVRANRQYEVEYGATAGAERTYIVGFEGSALNTDQLIAIRTEWFAPDGSALPDGLPGLTGRLARVHMGELQAGGPTDAAGQALGQFSIEPGIKTSVVRLPEEGVEREHYYIHVDGAPLTGSVDFAGRAGISRPDFSVNRVCYYSTGGAPDCRNKQSDDPALQSRPAQLVPFRVPVYDKANSEAQRAAFFDQDLEDPGPVYRWPYRPEMQFTVHDLQVEDVYRVEEDGTEVSVIADGVPSFYAGTTLSAGISYGIWGPLDDPLSPLNPTIDDIDGDGEREHRAFSWDLGNMSFGDVLPNTVDSPELQIYNYLDDLDGELQADDYLALRLLQLGDEVNVLWEFATLDFGLDPAEPTLVSADYPYSVVLARVYAGTEPAEDGAQIRWTPVGAGLVPDETTSLTEEGYAAVRLTFPTTQLGQTYQVRGELVELIVNGNAETQVGLEAATGTFKVIPGAPRYIALVTSADSYFASIDNVITANVVITDQHGNLVPEGTPVSWGFVGQGSFLSADNFTNQDGAANAVLLPGNFAETQELIVTAGSAEARKTLEALPIRATLNVTPTSVNACANESAQVTATFEDDAGNPVPDGTSVQWFNSAGSFSNTAEPLALTTTSNGVASGTWSPGLTRTPAGRVITKGSPSIVYLRSSMGGYTDSQYVQVTYDDFEYDIDHIVIAGDIVSSGETRAFDRPDGSVVNVPVPASSEITIRGPPSSTVSVSLSRPRIPTVIVDGNDVPIVPEQPLRATFPGNVTSTVVQLDENGVGSLSVLSKGELPSDAADRFDLIQHLRLTFTPDVGCVWEQDLYVAPSELVAALGNFALSVLIGDQGGASGFAGDLTGAFIPVYGDARDLTRELIKFFPSSHDEPSFLVIGLSSFGILADLGIIGLGPIVDAIKVLVKALPPGPLRKAVGEVWHKAVSAYKEGGLTAMREVLDEYRTVLVKMANLRAAERAVLNDLARVTADPHFLDTLATLTNKLGDDFVTTVATLASRPDLPTEYVGEAIRTASRFEDAASESLKNSGRLNEALEGLTKGLANGVDAEDIAQVMTKPVTTGVKNVAVFSGRYDHARFLEDIGELAEVNGLRELVHKLPTAVNLGHRFELEAAANLKRADEEIVALGREIVDGSDADIIIRRGGEEVFLQVKRSYNAFFKKKKYPTAVEFAEAWIQRAERELGVEDYSRIKYVIPESLDPTELVMPTTVRKLLEDRQIEIIEVEHLFTK